MTELYSKIMESFPSLDITVKEPVVKFSGSGELPSWFETTDLAISSVAAAGNQIAALITDEHQECGDVVVDRRLASFWFIWTLKPIDWEVPPPWDAIAGDYRTRDGWIRLHTNAPHHKEAALAVLSVKADREDVAQAVSLWQSDELETAVVKAGGCAAAMKTVEEWNQHPQGRAIANEPLVSWHTRSITKPRPRKVAKDRPLGGIRILDLTRVLAGPVASRFLAAYGADVLRIDPPAWEEPTAVPEVTLGKRCAGLDLKNEHDRAIFEKLVREADVLLHGYRADALEGLGYDSEAIRALNPDLIDIALNAYGWTGPWRSRRRFDSLVQMSSGIADFGMEQSTNEKPVPLPVQALDHATGYLMAAATVYAIRQRQHEGKILSARLSLAKTAHLLISTKRDNLGSELEAEKPDDTDPKIENTDWGPARRVRFPITISGTPIAWPYPASALRSAKPEWL